MRLKCWGGGGVSELRRGERVVVGLMGWGWEGDFGCGWRGLGRCKKG